MIADMLQRAKQVAAVEEHGKRTHQRVHLCKTFDDLVDDIANPRVTTVVLDLGMCAQGSAGIAARIIRDRGDSIVVHAVHGLAEGETHALRALAALSRQVRSVYPRYHDLDACLSDHPNVFFPSATNAILAAVGKRVPVEIAHLFTCCVVLGERRTTKGRVAAESGVSQKRIDARLAAKGLPACIKLLAGMRCAHIVYRLERGCDPQVAAHLAGFGSVRAMENFVRKHMRRTPWQLVADGGSKFVADRIANPTLATPR